jgi:hypothetical protein
VASEGSAEELIKAGEESDRSTHTWLAVGVGTPPYLIIPLRIFLPFPCPLSLSSAGPAAPRRLL